MADLITKISDTERAEYGELYEKARNTYDALWNPDFRKMVEHTVIMDVLAHYARKDGDVRGDRGIGVPDIFYIEGRELSPYDLIRHIQSDTQTGRAVLGGVYSEWQELHGNFLSNAQAQFGEKGLDGVDTSTRGREFSVRLVLESLGRQELGPADDRYGIFFGLAVNNWYQTVGQPSLPGGVEFLQLIWLDYWRRK